MKVRIIILTILVALVTCGAASPAEDGKFSKGLDEFNAGNWATAADLLLAAVSSSPSDIAIRITAGVALANVKRYAEALDQFRTSAHLSPEGILPQLLIDGTYSEMGNQLESRKARDNASRMLNLDGAFGKPTSSDQMLVQSLKVYPKNAIAYCLLGDLYQLQGRLAPAREQYVEANKLAPKWAKPVFNLGLANLQTDPKTAESNFLQVTRLDPGNSHAYLWLGDARLQQDNVNGAIDAYNFAAKNPSISAEAQTRLGNAQFRAGNFSLAQQEFQQAATQAPGDPRPIVGEAQVLQVEGKLQQAEKLYQQAIDVAAMNSMPQSQAYVQNQAATVQFKQGKFDQATANLMEAFRLNPTLENADLLALAHQKAGTLQNAVTASEQALKRSPHTKTARIFLLSAYKLNNNLIGAAGMAEQLTQIDAPNAHIYHSEAACIYKKQGNTAKAIESYAKALRGSRADTWPQIMKSASQSGTIDVLTGYFEMEFKSNKKASDGLILFELQSYRNNVAGMLAAALSLVKVKPDDPVCQFKLGIAYEKSGDKQKALEAYKKAAAGDDADIAEPAKAKVDKMRQ